MSFFHYSKSIAICFRYMHIHKFKKNIYTTANYIVFRLVCSIYNQSVWILYFFLQVYELFTSIYRCVNFLHFEAYTFSTFIYWLFSFGEFPAFRGMWIFYFHLQARVFSTFNLVPGSDGFYLQVLLSRGNKKKVT